jgi:hypothetical protein
LILAAPSNEVSLESTNALTLTGVTQPVATTDIVEVASNLVLTPRVSNRTPTMPFPVLNV